MTDPRRRRKTAWMALGALLLLVRTGTAADPALNCQSAKNTEAGKYGYCRQKAAAKFATTGDGAALMTALAKCEAKFTAKWPTLEAKATALGGACPSVGDLSAIQGAVDQHTTNLATALAGGTLSDCAGDLLMCQGDLGSCTGSLGTCTGHLSTCTGDLGTCTTNVATTQANLVTCNGTLAATQNGLTTCQSDLAAAQAGTATAAQVLVGQTFTSGAGTGVVGTMPNNGAVGITPGSSAQAIAAGYHDGSGSVAGDTDLVASNITTGVNVFGVTGTALPSQPVKSGLTTCWDPADNSAPVATIPCAGSGQDGATLKGQPRSYTTNVNGTITDEKTGLVWEKLDDNNANGIHDYSAQFTWPNAFRKIKVLNGDVAGCIGANNPDACCTGAGTGSCTPFVGQTDWRLPNVNELQTLADYGRINPTIDPAFHTSCAAACTAASCSCTQSGIYWTSSTYRNDPLYVWVVYFNGGFLGADSKVSNYFVRAVRGGS